ncbi:flavodoxin family protein [Clostridium perfringens]|uniref:Flavin reductase n=1 Tax=Clostridium perfringens (strain SM101 / Type A) TaxID=289380 RepID=Q0SUL3_CLOPS|nr:flavodoxin family protein [Clostridium perfringens]ABG87839.1 flavin reductase [Clostridium perfringens SM101]EJT5916765.1 flavodoxin family protein [Clostridium perfringens]EJT5924452.1 flavodoxin family protein [Clostridium perfringens]EJT5939180.1 flavodoxin family protein [Clostridium perfringens]EJT6135436.1 flavodoxin family protein [Clostridium perfringens]
MKVLLVNGSPNREGCTYTALKEVSKTLEENGIDTEIFQVGNKPIGGCIGCGSCKKTGECFMKDCVNEFVEKAKGADGFVFGSPVYYAAASGSITSFLDRAFYSGGKHMAFKPGAVICSARRAGTTSTLDQLSKYLTICNMPVVSSQYWNMVHGNTPEEVKKDLEGMQTMRVLGRNMAWLIKCIDLGKKNNILKPELEERERTNFIR